MSKQKKSIPSSTLLRVIERVQTVLLGALVFLLPMMFDMANTSYNHTKIALFLVVGSIVLLLWGVRFWASRRPGIHAPALFWPGLALMLAGGLSLANASSPATSLQALWVLGYYLLFYLYFANAVDQGQKLRFFLLTACLGTLFASGYGALQYYGILPGHPEYVQGAGNIISGLGNRNFLAEFLNSWVVFVPVLLLLFKTAWVRGLLLVCAGMAFVVLLLVNSIGALAGLLGGAVVLVLGVLAHRASVRFLKPHWGWLLGWLGVLLLGGVLVALPGPLKAKTVSRQLSQAAPAPVPRPAAPPTVQPAGLLQDGSGGLEQLLAFWLANSGDVRILDWWVGLEMFKAHPLFGVGLNHYGIQFLNYKKIALDALGEGALQQHVRRTENAHNDYVQSAAELGAVGTMVVLVLLGALVVGTLRQWRRQNAPLKRMLVAGAFAGVVAILLDALVNFPLHLPASGMNLVLLAGVAHSVLFAKKTKTMPKSTARALGAALAAFAIFVFVVSVRDWQADRHLNSGNRYLQSEHYQLARREYEQSLSMAFGPTEVLFRLGGVYYQLDDRQQAKAYFERSLAHYLTEESLWNLAVIYFQDEAYEQSLRYVERLLATDPQPELRDKALQLKEHIEGR